MKNFKKGVFFIFYLLPLVSMSQSMNDVKQIVNDKPHIIIDYGIDKNMHTKVPFRGRLLNGAGRQAGSQGAVFEVTYIGFNATQMAAFQYAVDIWAALLQSDVPIRISAQMSSLGSGVIGQTGIPSRHANFDNAQKINTFYAVAMAEKMAGTDLNDPSEPDITMELNSNFAFYYETDRDTPAGLSDFVTVVLHEIGHGLGFSDGTFATESTGFYTVFGSPTVFDRHLENGSGQNIVENFDDNTPALGIALTNDNLFFNSFLFPSASIRPQLYAPDPFNPGSSVAHLDEDRYPEGTPHSLMTPNLGFAEAIHDPGFSLEMFMDMGWVSMDIDFDRLLDSEDSLITSNHTVTATVKGDSAVIAGGVSLHYSDDGFASETVVNMVATGNANEYTANLLSSGTEETISYYINVDAAGGKAYTSPGEAPNFFWQFINAADTVPPVIDHAPRFIAFLSKTIIPIDASVLDNIGAKDLILTYKVNGGAESSFIIPLIDSTTDGFYIGNYSFDWDIGALPGVVDGAIIEYKLEIEDLAANANMTADPETGFYEILVAELNDPVALYENDFNSPTNDFTGPGFTIGLESGFDSDAIHSDHPYRVVDGVFDDDSVTLIYLLKSPVILSDQDASMSFDEVVLVEPGTGLTEFGDDEFWDYVIVEGTNNLGESWHPVADGYDSRLHTEWLEHYNSEMDTDFNSLALGDKSLFLRHEFDLSANGIFAAEDTVVLRFRIYADPLAHGWGWAIDNLKIQIDEKPPVITQITPDYLMIGETELVLKSKVVDNTELDSVIYEVDFNGQMSISSFPGTANLFSLNLGFPAIKSTDVLKYRIIAVDKAPSPNTNILPAVGFFEIPVAVFEAARNMYVNDFNTTTDDFIGVNFNVTTPEKFSDPALVSLSPYSDAPFETSEMSYILKYPIILNQNTAFVQWDEMVLVEAGNDQVAFEASKDGGVTWMPVIDPYDASAQSFWQNLFVSNLDEDGNSLTKADPAFMVRRFFNILDNPAFNGGDEVLLRFRMTVNDNVHGWGWIIDNFEIQGPTTAIDDEMISAIQIYPNPTNTGRVVLKGNLSGTRSIIIVTDILGKIVLQDEAAIINNNLHTTLDLSGFKNGIYLISVSDKSGIYTSRLIVE